ncbi:DUF3011 domain-containing protein [Luteimonas salinilitoris]|uniref:DUF3011 domain-containing protein n=1 Tax=Luteimonas salinilitoris TaxID=3237697 RepID=A0ABV4HWF3_9GAMM
MSTKIPMPALAAFLACFGLPSSAAAQATVECISHDYRYSECYAPLEQPQLVYQKSHSACIINKTWGFNPATSRVWVSDGCSGVFADAGGYHHGVAGTADGNARQYDQHGHDAGTLVAGAVLGALIEGAADSRHDRRHTHSNARRYSTPSGYNGCHGVGCLIDNPDQTVTDDRPQFDREGNPNFDTQGNYQGCHGIGCDVDDPGSDNYGSDDPPEPGQTEFSDDSGGDSDDSGSDDPPEPDQTEFSDDDD